MDTLYTFWYNTTTLKLKVCTFWGVWTQRLRWLSATVGPDLPDWGSAAPQLVEGVYPPLSRKSKASFQSLRALLGGSGDLVSKVLSTFIGVRSTYKYDYLTYKPSYWSHDPLSRVERVRASTVGH